MAIHPGTHFGPYEIQSALGAGGMGEVYRARDTRLNRVVAIKVLPSGVAGNPQRRERFDREARAISSLNHPHICTLYDVGHHEGADYLVMELLEGQTLADRLQKGPVPLDQALPYAIEIADALSAAHRRGIVHRDLKPANVMLTKSGAKLLDFGIAKAVAHESDRSVRLQPDGTPRIEPQTMTAEGTLLGTLHYMAPEQLEGRDADARSDLFAFGAVLYEMLTGARAFPGDSQSKVIAAVLDSEPPPINTAQPLTPPALDHLVATCLAKNPDDRWQSASDVKRQLEWFAVSARSTTTPVAAGQRARSGRRAGWTTALVTLGALIAGSALTWVVWLRRAMPPVLPEARLEISTPPTTQPWSIAISPDGFTVAFVADSEGQPALWLRPLNAVAAQPLAGTTGATLPFWSPDSKAIGFFAGGKLKRIDAAGGAAQTLADAHQPHGGTWGPDGTIVFSPHQISPLLRVSAGGGESVALTQLSSGQVGHHFPQFLPGGIHLLYFAGGSPEVAGDYIGTLDGRLSRRLLAARSPAVFLPPGHVLFVRENVLFAQALDPIGLELTGNAVRIADSVVVSSGIGGTDPAAISASNTGDILYRSAAAGGRRQLTWIDRSGRTVTQVGSSDSARTRAQTAVSLSPNGRRVALARGEEGNTDIWLVDLERTGAMSRFTFTANNLHGVWSRDGGRVTFGSNRNGNLDIYQRSIAGDRDEPLLVAPGHQVPADWSPDGSTLLYLNADPKTRLDIWALAIGGDERAVPVIQSPYEDLNPQFSPDGAWIAYQSDVSARHEVYLRPFRGAGAPLLISTSGGMQPRWRPDGKELFYLGLDRRMMAVTITLSADGGSADAGIPAPLFQTMTIGAETAQRQYEPSADGQRFLMDTPTGEVPAPLVLIQHWRP